VVLTLVTPGRGGDLRPLARAAALSGIDYFQVREKGLDDRSLLAGVRGAVEAASAGPMRVIVNGRPDVAALAGAHGVQLPEAGLGVAAVREAFPGLEVGASRHGLEGARRAEEEGAHWVSLGPIFATPGKEDRVLGLARLGEAARALAIPVFAIGGIDGATAPAARAAGAAGLMAIRIFLGADLARSARALRGDP
jgi:thiamine-phosphate diphosphorylase